MLDDKIKQFISISVTGRVFVFCTKEGIKSTSKIRKYEKQVRDYLEQKAKEGANMKQLEKLTSECLESIRQEIQGELAQSSPALATPVVTAVKNEPEKNEPEKNVTEPKQEAVKSPQTDAETLTNEAVHEPASGKVAEDVKTTEPDTNKVNKKESKPASNPQADSEKKHEVASYQDKLTINRKPVVELLQKECVDFHLLTPKRAKYWVHNLSGRIIKDVEAEIVNEISDNLLKNVRTYMRKNKKDHPWQSPSAQEQVRSDITSTRTIKGMLMLTSQILWEARQHKNSDNNGLLKKMFKKFSR
jgi:hypothetical protein